MMMQIDVASLAADSNSDEKVSDLMDSIRTAAHVTSIAASKTICSRRSCTATAKVCWHADS